jgi:hypothetical protein
MFKYWFSGYQYPINTQLFKKIEHKLFHGKFLHLVSYRSKDLEQNVYPFCCVRLLGICYMKIPPLFVCPG